MWFKRKTGNRRLGREHVLDVKLRSSQVRAARFRMGAIALGLVFASVLGVYSLVRAGQYGLNRLVYRNDAFAMREVDIQTDGIIAPGQLRRWAGIKPGDNLLAMDLARVKRDLELVSLVESVSVERILPRTLRIRVVEREPVAQVSIPRPRQGGGIELACYQLDSDGYVIQPLEPQLCSGPPAVAPELLPSLSGLNPADVQPGRRVETPQLQAALRLINAFDRSSMSGVVDLKKIDVSGPEVLVAITGQGSEITFGLADPEQALLRWQEIHEMGQRMSKVIASLDLAITNNIPARWLEASAAPPSSPKLPKPIRNKKKHV
jgi:hypothetical protein